MLFKTLRVSNSNSNYYDNIDERYTTSYDLTMGASGGRPRSAHRSTSRAPLRGGIVGVVILVKVACYDGPGMDGQRFPFPRSVGISDLAA